MVIGREDLEQDVLDDDGETEGSQERHQESGAPAPFQKQHVHRIARDPHNRKDEQRREPRRNRRLIDDDPDQVGADHGDVAMGEVDDAHDAEHQRQPAGEQGVKAAEQDALEEHVHPIHGSDPTPEAWRTPKYAAVI